MSNRPTQKTIQVEVTEETFVQVSMIKLVRVMPKLNIDRTRLRPVDHSDSTG